MRRVVGSRILVARLSAIVNPRTDAPAPNTLGVTARGADVRLARQVGQEVDYEGPGTSFAAPAVGSGGS